MFLTTPEALYRAIKDVLSESNHFLLQSSTQLPESIVSLFRTALELINASEDVISSIPSLSSALIHLASVARTARLRMARSASDSPDALNSIFEPLASLMSDRVLQTRFLLQHVSSPDRTFSVIRSPDALALWLQAATTVSNTSFIPTPLFLSGVLEPLANGSTVHPQALLSPPFSSYLISRDVSGLEGVNVDAWGAINVWLLPFPQLLPNAASAAASNAWLPAGHTHASVASHLRDHVPGSYVVWGDTSDATLRVSVVGPSGCAEHVDVVASVTIRRSGAKAGANTRSVAPLPHIILRFAGPVCGVDYDPAPSLAALIAAAGPALAHPAAGSRAAHTAHTAGADVRPPGALPPPPATMPTPLAGSADGPMGDLVGTPPRATRAALRACALTSPAALSGVPPPITHPLRDSSAAGEEPDCLPTHGALVPLQRPLQRGFAAGGSDASASAWASVAQPSTTAHTWGNIHQDGPAAAHSHSRSPPSLPTAIDAPRTSRSSSATSDSSSASSAPVEPHPPSCEPSAVVPPVSGAAAPLRVASQAHLMVQSPLSSLQSTSAQHPHATQQPLVRSLGPRLERAGSHVAAAHASGQAGGDLVRGPSYEVTQRADQSTTTGSSAAAAAMRTQPAMQPVAQPGVQPAAPLRAHPDVTVATATCAERPPPRRGSSLSAVPAQHDVVRAPPTLARALRVGLAAAGDDSASRPQGAKVGTCAPTTPSAPPSTAARGASAAPSPVGPVGEESADSVAVAVQPRARASGAPSLGLRGRAADSTDVRVWRSCSQQAAASAIAGDAPRATAWARGSAPPRSSSASGQPTPQAQRVTPAPAMRETASGAPRQRGTATLPNRAAARQERRVPATRGSAAVARDTRDGGTTAATCAAPTSAADTGGARSAKPGDGATPMGSRAHRSHSAMQRPPVPADAPRSDVVVADRSAPSHYAVIASVYQKGGVGGAATAIVDAPLPGQPTTRVPYERLASTPPTAHYVRSLSTRPGPTHTMAGGAMVSSADLRAHLAHPPATRVAYGSSDTGVLRTATAVAHPSAVSMVRPQDATAPHSAAIAPFSRYATTGRHTLEATHGPVTISMRGPTPSTSAGTVPSSPVVPRDHTVHSMHPGGCVALAQPALTASVGWTGGRMVPTLRGTLMSDRIVRDTRSLSPSLRQQQLGWSGSNV